MKCTIAYGVLVCGYVIVLLLIFSMLVEDIITSTFIAKLAWLLYISWI